MEPPAVTMQFDHDPRQRSLSLQRLSDAFWGSWQWRMRKNDELNKYPMLSDDNYTTSILSLDIRIHNNEDEGPQKSVKQRTHALSRNRRDKIEVPQTCFLNPQ